jgi:hypothetical protein
MTCGTVHAKLPPMGWAGMAGLSNMSIAALLSGSSRHYGPILGISEIFLFDENHF